MSKRFETFIWLTVPTVVILSVAFYFGYGAYYEELADGNDAVDAFRWAFLTGFFLTPVGLILGVAAAVLVKLSLIELKENLRTKPELEKLIQ